MALLLLALEFVGMVDYALTFFHDLCDEELESDSSSIGDALLLDHPLSRECAMADAPGQLPEAVESAETHTPPDHRVEVLMQVHVHGDEL